MFKRKNELKPNKLTKEAQRSMAVRCLTAVIGLAIVVPTIVLGEWPFLVLAVLLAGIGAFELVRCAKRKYNPLLYIVTIVLIVFLAIFPICKNIFEVKDPASWHLYTGYDSIYISAFVLSAGAVLIFCMPIIDKNFEVRDAAYIFAFGIIIGMGIQSMLFLRYFPQHVAYNTFGSSQKDPFIDYAWSQSLFWLVIGGTCIADIGAYFTGVLFGKHKMLERISPKKTWEGFVGGVFFSMAFILSFGLIMAAIGQPIIPGIFDLDHWYLLLILSVSIPIMSVIGDFVFSSIKRYYGIKDFGFILPGHGGVLDRLDSVFFTCVTSTVLIIIFSCVINGNWGDLFV